MQKDKVGLVKSHYKFKTRILKGIFATKYWNSFAFAN